MSPSKIIFFAIPIFLVFILFEWSVGLWRRRKKQGPQTYRFSDSINSLSLGILNQLYGFLSLFIVTGIYAWVYNLLEWNTHPIGWWTTIPGVLLALLIYDFCYYWFHRCNHEIVVLWASHVVHHQSQEFNLTTALRQPSTYDFTRWIFYLPLVFMGVPLNVFVLVSLIDLLYQFWVHTEHVKKLGWFDYVFCSPSNHRVHHGVNAPYIDKNYGGILIIWDRMFGTFQEETEKPIYGTMAPINSWDPVWGNLKIFYELLLASWRTRRWIDKIKVWFKPPGWQPADLAEVYPYPKFDIEAVKIYNPRLTSTQIALALVHFTAILFGTMVFLWSADTLTYLQVFILCVSFTAPLWAVGVYLNGNISLLELLALDFACLSIMSGSNLLLGYEWFYLFKPLMVLSLAVNVWHRVFWNKELTDRSAKIGAILLIIGLIAGSLGDLLLLFVDQYPLIFLAGLASFLLGHVLYLILCKRAGIPWFKSSPALYLFCALAVCIVIYLFPMVRHDIVLTIAVVVYSLVIALFVAQAVGRTKVLATNYAILVALGAVLFVCSDVLVALNHFAAPIAYFHFWNLALYYTAQFLIAHCLLPKYKKMIQ